MVSDRNGLNAASRIRRGWRLTLIFLLLFVALLGTIMFVGSDFSVQQLVEMFSHLEVRLLVVLLLLSCVNFISRACRWHWYSKQQGLNVSVKDSFSYYVAGFAMGVTPGRMGELIRMWLMRQGHRISYHRTLPLLIADRVNDLLIIIVLTLAAGLIAGSDSLRYVFLALFVMVMAYVLLRHPDVLISLIDSVYAKVRRGKKLFAAARRSLRTGREMFSASSAVFASIFSLVAWLAECIAFYLLLSALDTGISIDLAIFIYSFATLVGALSFLPGGLGGFEVVAVILLGAQGADLGEAVFATTVIRLTTLWFSVVLGSFLLSHLLINLNMRVTRVKT